jgi:hypothetical protein
VARPSRALGLALPVGWCDRGVMARLIAAGGERRGWKLRVAYGAFRALLYAVLGIALEVALYSMARAGREVPILEYLFQFDWRVDPDLHLGGPWQVPLKTMFGQSSLWMIPVYILPAIAIENLYHRRLYRHAWWIRAPIYGLVIMGFELVTGLALHAIVDYRIWMYVDAANVMQETSFLILPIWMLAGMLIERIYRELMDPELRERLQDKLDELFGQLV